jgi:hypothetical protein
MKGIGTLRRELEKLRRVLLPADFGKPPRGRVAWDAWAARLRAAREALEEGLRVGRFRLDPDGRLDPHGVPPNVLGYARGGPVGYQERF